jgi:hypothetical protein
MCVHNQFKACLVSPKKPASRFFAENWFAKIGKLWPAKIERNLPFYMLTNLNELPIKERQLFGLLE